MINSWVINNVDGIHTYSINTDTLPLHDFDVTPQERTITDRNKAQESGLWPTLSFRGGMEIHTEGDIFGTSSADYFTKRMDLIAALYGDPNSPPPLTTRKYGDLVITLEGSTEDWTCPFIVTLFSAPVQGLSPSRTPFAVTFLSWNPWFIGVDSGDKYYYA